jgi:hypothetical protein
MLLALCVWSLNAFRFEFSNCPATVAISPPQYLYQVVMHAASGVTSSTSGQWNHFYSHLIIIGTLLKTPLK